MSYPSSLPEERFLLLRLAVSMRGSFGCALIDYNPVARRLTPRWWPVGAATSTVAVQLHHAWMSVARRRALRALSRLMSPKQGAPRQPQVFPPPQAIA